MSAEQGGILQRNKRTAAGLLCAAAFAGLAGESAVSAGQPQTTNDLIEQTIQECASWQGHRFEACAAYIFNDAHFSLQAYYKYVKSDSIFSGLKDRFQLKYMPAARQKINQWTNISTWPRGTNTVDGPEIQILAADSSLKCNKAVLQTEENWGVFDKAGDLLYREDHELHTVLLRRVPDERFRLGSRVLHAWVVDNIYKGQKNIKPTC